ncbi:hypothetical protein ACFQ6N_07485 [Kitasatospora sp. NPDC056446]|uniref:hypothetical protein n=1 Tax=Kitasatospora sp. NPDC056446 TaxID=3345819 RepID=UPI0036899966
MTVAPRSVRTTGLLIAAGLITAVGLATAATAAPATGASKGSAALPAPAPTVNGNFTLCSGPNYASFVVFEKRNSATRIVAPNTCLSLTLTGQSSEKITLWGVRPDGKEFKIATDTFDDAVGERIKTLGTPDENDWTTF